MGRYTAIAEVGSALVRLLQQEMVPDTLQNPDAIGLCSPADRGDFIVGIHLYDIRQSEEIRANAMLSRGERELQYPPAYVNLYYMITVCSVGDIKFRSGEEQKILGRIVQIFHDYSCLDGETMEPVTERKPMDLAIQMHTLDMDDKIKIYNVPNAGYHLSLFYKAAPVEIESRKSRRVHRVMDMDITLKEQ